MRLLFLSSVVYKETIKVKKVSISLAYVSFFLYLCALFCENDVARSEK